MILQRLEKIRERIGRAAARSGRAPDDITLIAVTKKFAAATVREAYYAGLRDFGENYVQEFEEKHPHLEDLIDARFHLIGHLQTNKARKAAELFSSIQTVDSPKLLRKLAETGEKLHLMLEVKLSEEQAKEGASPEEIPAILDAARGIPQLEVRGLMTMPPWSENPGLSRPYFAKLRELGRQYDLPELSMGMSHDLEVAIEEGATMIRVGTGLFGPRRKA